MTDEDDDTPELDCPACGEGTMRVDWATSTLTPPQRLSTYCDACPYTETRHPVIDEDNPDGYFWKSNRVVCRLCAAEAVATYRVGADDEDNLRCPSCGHMTAGEVADGGELCGA